MDDLKLRENLVELLHGGSAHITLEKAIEGVHVEIRNFKPSSSLHSVYEELEHIRIAQEDILRYTIEEGWESPEWPGGYWPKANGNIDDETWNSTIDRFNKDLSELISLVNDRKIDLTAEIPHGQGRTYLREILLVADHNAYHLGKIVDIRKSLGDWYLSGK